ncbi:hypothetical protein KFE25_002291 [Diacronema lutheri]|uniref:RAP domain-containing protein n=1 Tax=Diacronema lutheri TaxID=2081491 RepID=A0A8J6C070_DIALT|nr:hypothetical protein KFE25_002291 [Diacronema lutheri]
MAAAWRAIHPHKPAVAGLRGLGAVTSARVLRAGNATLTTALPARRPADGELEERVAELLREAAGASPRVGMLARLAAQVAHAGGRAPEASQRARAEAACAAAARTAAPLLPTAEPSDAAATVLACVRCAELRARAFEPAAHALCAERGVAALPPQNLGILANATARNLQLILRARAARRDGEPPDGAGHAAEQPGARAAERLLGSIGAELVANHDRFAPADVARVAWALAATRAALARRAPPASPHDEGNARTGAGGAGGSAPAPAAEQSAHAAFSAAFGAVRDAVLARAPLFAADAQSRANVAWALVTADEAGGARAAAALDALAEATTAVLEGTERGSARAAGALAHPDDDAPFAPTVTPTVSVASGQPVARALGPDGDVNAPVPLISLAQLAWAYAQRPARRAPPRTPDAPPLAAAAIHVPPVVRSGACSPADHPTEHRALFRAIARAAARTLAHEPLTQPHSLCNLAWAYAVRGEHEPDLTAAIVAALRKHATCAAGDGGGDAGSAWARGPLPGFGRAEQVQLHQWALSLQLDSHACAEPLDGADATDAGGRVGASATRGATGGGSPADLLPEGLRASWLEAAHASHRDARGAIGVASPVPSRARDERGWGAVGGVPGAEPLPPGGAVPTPFAKLPPQHRGLSATLSRLGAPHVNDAIVLGYKVDIQMLHSAAAGAAPADGSCADGTPAPSAAAAMVRAREGVVIDLTDGSRYERGSGGSVLRAGVRMRHRHLERSGYAVITLPYWEWRALRTMRARAELLNAHLARAGAASLAFDVERAVARADEAARARGADGQRNGGDGGGGDGGGGDERAPRAVDDGADASSALHTRARHAAPRASLARFDASAARERGVWTGHGTHTPRVWDARAVQARERAAAGLTRSAAAHARAAPAVDTDDTGAGIRRRPKVGGDRRGSKVGKAPAGRPAGSARGRREVRGRRW